MKIFTDKNNSITLKAFIINQYTKTKLNFEELDSTKHDALHQKLRNLTKLTRFPILELENKTTISESNAIVKYLSSGSKLYPQKQTQQIDQWLDFDLNLSLNLIYWIGSLVKMTINKDKLEKAKKNTMELLKRIENEIAKNKEKNGNKEELYLVGNSISSADICIFSSLFPLISPQNGVLLNEENKMKIEEEEKDFDQIFPLISKWFLDLLAINEFQQGLKEAKMDLTQTTLGDDIFNRLVYFGYGAKPRYTLSKPPEKPIFITTPIYYTNGEPHIGHVYTTLLGDVLRRWSMEIRRFPTFYITGTDEHGLKVEQAAQKMNVTPQEIADINSQKFRDMFEKLGLEYDRFIRTTNEDHVETVQDMWNTLVSNGHIYKGSYEGWYCVSDEAFLTELQVQDGLDPQTGKPCKVSRDSGNPVVWTKEESYMFRLSAFQDKLLAWLENNPKAIVPKFRQIEIMDFIKKGLKDLSVSRTLVKWGIPVPNDPEHVMYVWIDALTNYFSATAGFLNFKSKYKGPKSDEEFDQKFEKFKKSFNYFPDKSIFPADYHLIGKDILRFHAVYWPAFLMGADLPLPKSIVAHGWWTKDKKKISKSLGNHFDPVETATKYGIDPLRYFLLREGNISTDGDYSDSGMQQRLNSDLADDLGNLVLRAISKQLNSSQSIPHFDPQQTTESDQKLIRMLEDLPGWVDHYYFLFNFQQVLSAIWEVIQECNRYITHEKPWELKKLKNFSRLNNVLYVLLECVRIVGILLYPIIPQKSSLLLDQLGFPKEKRNSDYLKFGCFVEGEKLGQDKSILFEKFQENKTFKSKNPKKSKKPKNNQKK